MSTIEETLKQKLIEAQLTIACAESLTSGAVQTLLGSQSGSSGCFVGGVTAYNLHQKVSILGVNAEHAEQFNCVSSRTAREMATGCLSLFGSDVAIATTGYIEPCPEFNVNEPYAEICIAINFSNHISFLNKLYMIPRLSRQDAQKHVANISLEFALLMLEIQDGIE